MKVTVRNSETQVEIKEINLIQTIKGDTCFIGRSQQSGLVLDSAGVSRLHGKFTVEDDQYYFCDLGSSNGSLINGEEAIATQNYLLKPGDIIRIGEFMLTMQSVVQRAEECAETVMGVPDATVILGAQSAKLSQSNQGVINAELVDEEQFALLKVDTPESENEIKEQTQELFVAINRRVVSELKAAGDLTREAYLSAIRKARDSVEQNQLIDPEQVEKEAEKYWQSISANTANIGSRLGAAAIKKATDDVNLLKDIASKGANSLGQRVGAAAKAALGEFMNPQIPPSKQLKSANPNEDNVSETIEVDASSDSEEDEETLDSQ